MDALADFIRECGLPTRLTELSSKAEITPELLRQVADSVRTVDINDARAVADLVREALSGLA